MVSTVISKKAQEISKKAKILVLNSEKPEGFDPLEDMIGSMKTKAPVDVERIVKEEGFEIACRDSKL